MDLEHRTTKWWQRGVGGKNEALKNKNKIQIFSKVL